MFGKKLAAATLAGTLAALTPQFAAANDVNTCASVARTQGIHQYDTRRGLVGFQEGRGVGCEYKAIGGRWRVTDTHSLHSDRERSRFYNDWDRAQREVARRAERAPGGLDEVNRNMRDVQRTIRGVNSLLRTLDRLGN